MIDLDWVNGDPVALRKAYAEERASRLKDAPPDVTVSVLERGALSGLTFTPTGGGTGAPILYFHGGSWMLGSPETHHTLTAWLAQETGRIVHSVRYPLATEEKFPAQSDAARAACAALTEADGSIFVAGDSAGGAMALWAAGDQTRNVLGIACFYPAFGLTNSASIEAFGQSNPALNSAAIAAMYARLGVSGPDLQRSVAPTGAPVLILAAGKDPLRDDCDALATYLHARHVSLLHIEDAPHAFLHDVGTVSAYRRWLDRTARWMEHLETPNAQKVLLRLFARIFRESLAPRSTTDVRGNVDRAGKRVWRARKRSRAACEIPEDLYIQVGAR